MSTVKIERNNTQILARIDRPGALNAINFAVMDELEDLLTDIESDKSVRALILTGSGTDAFVSGGDLREFHTLKTAEEARKMSRRMLDILYRIERLPCWTIACVNGPAYGGGCEMMLAFDFRTASGSATFGFTQSKFYLPPGWGGITRLIERVGRSTALKWLAKAATVDADTALERGLVDEVYPQEELTAATRKFADDITKNDRRFIQNMKEGALKFSRYRLKAIEAELENFAEFWESEQHEQRVQKFLKRKEK